MQGHGWSIKPLKEIVEFLDGKRIPLKDSERAKIQGNIPYYGANGQVDSINKFIFNESLILLAEDGGNFGSKTRSIAYKIDGKSWVNNHAHVLRPKPGCDIDYLKWILSFYDVDKHITGSTRKKLTKGDAEKMPIPFPPLPIQQKIASILENADAARQKRAETLKLTEQFLQSAFLEMFGDPVKNEKGWDWKKIRDVASIKIGPFGSLLHSHDYIKGGIPSINPIHIKKRAIYSNENFSVSEEKAKELKNYRLELGDIVLARRGEMGRCGIVTENEVGYLCGTGSVIIRVSKLINCMYLLYILSSDKIREILENNAKGITMKNLNSGTVGLVPIPLPPLPLQKKFAALVEKVEKLREKQRQSETELEQLFQSLMQRAFNGELVREKEEALRS